MGVIPLLSGQPGHTDPQGQAIKVRSAWKEETHVAKRSHVISLP